MSTISSSAAAAAKSSSKNASCLLRTRIKDMQYRPPRPKSAYSDLCDLNQRMERVSLLDDCLAVELQKLGPTGAGPPENNQPHHYWMFDSGYLLFQSFLEANSKCFWDGSLVAAVRGLEYRGYVSPGVLFMTGSQCALEVLRTAWSRNVLRPPPNYTITLVGDVEGCKVLKVRQAGFTPLPDAVCLVILELGASGRTANIETIKKALKSTFPSIEQPSSQIIYDTLADLMAYNKVYQTCRGYFVATPDSLRFVEGGGSRSILMSTAEAISMLHGEMTTIREGSKTHQAVQTNLADVICGGNKNDKVLYARATAKLSSTGRRLERRHSMKMGGSARRLTSLQRAGSVRLLPPDSPSKKCSLLSKLFKWTRSTKQPLTPTIVPCEDQKTSSHPQEWFNSTVLHLHHVATQTCINEVERDWMENTLKTRRRSLSTSRLPRKMGASPSSRPSTPSSCKTPLYSSTPKALSSCASSGYNSLPRSLRSRATKELHQAQAQPQQPVTKMPELRTTVDEASGIVTTTITNPSTTRIYLEQSTSPVRSVITVRNNGCAKVSSGTAMRQGDKRSEIDSPKLAQRPSSVYHRAEESPPSRVPIPLEKMKFPSTETIQLEEKLILSNSKNERNQQNNNLSDASLKSGSLIDVHLQHNRDSELNNVKRPSVSMNPIQPAGDKLIESLSYKNLLKETNQDDKVDNIKINLTEVKLADKERRDSNLHPFPSLASLHFTSIAAQNILKGVSITSLDNLVDLNISSDKNISNNHSFHTDLGIV